MSNSCHLNSSNFLHHFLLTLRIEPRIFKYASILSLDQAYLFNRDVISSKLFISSKLSLLDWRTETSLSLGCLVIFTPECHGTCEHGLSCHLTTWQENRNTNKQVLVFQEGTVTMEDLSSHYWREEDRLGESKLFRERNLTKRIKFAPMRESNLRPITYKAVT